MTSAVLLTSEVSLASPWVMSHCAVLSQMSQALMEDGADVLLAAASRRRAAGGEARACGTSTGRRIGGPACALAAAGDPRPMTPAHVGDPAPACTSHGDEPAAGRGGGVLGPAAVDPEAAAHQRAGATAWRRTAVRELPPPPAPPAPARAAPLMRLIAPNLLRGVCAWASAAAGQREGAEASRCDPTTLVPRAAAGAGAGTRDPPVRKSAGARASARHKELDRMVAAAASRGCGVSLRRVRALVELVDGHLRDACAGGRGRGRAAAAAASGMRWIPPPSSRQGGGGPGRRARFADAAALACIAWFRRASSRRGRELLADTLERALPCAGDRAAAAAALVDALGGSCRHDEVPLLLQAAAAAAAASLPAARALCAARALPAAVAAAERTCYVGPATASGIVLASALARLGAGAGMGAAAGVFIAACGRSADPFVARLAAASAGHGWRCAAL